jgi:hypothetical protein
VLADHCKAELGLGIKRQIANLPGKGTHDPPQLAGYLEPLIERQPRPKREAERFPLCGNRGH